MPTGTRVRSSPAGRATTPDRSAELVARLAAGDRPSAPRHRRLVAAAAAITLLVATGAFVAIQARDDTSPGVASGPGDPRTGWFLPPEGWSVSSVDTEHLDVGEDTACSCTSWIAARPGDGGEIIVLNESAAGEAFDSSGSPIDVGGRSGRISQLDADWSWLVAESRGRQVTLMARGVVARDLAALADAALDQRDAGEDLTVDHLPLPDRFVGTHPAIKPPWRAEALLVVTATEADTGRELIYQVVPAGYLRFDILEAGPLRVEDGLVSGIASDPDGNRWLIVLGGPEDLVVGRSPFGDPVDVFDEDELRQFASGLREVPTADWRAALATAEGDVDRTVLEAETLTSPPLIEP